MDNLFYDKIAKSTAHRPIRDHLSSEVFANTTLFATLINMALSVNDENHHKACWTLELVLETKIDWLGGYLTIFCNTLSKYRHEGALRSVSKICMFAVVYDSKLQKSANRFITAQQREQITEACFDWLIDPKGKVATKAYAMRTLYLLGKNEEWINPELVRILSEDASKHTAAYTAAAKDILKKINR